MISFDCMPRTPSGRATAWCSMAIVGERSRLLVAPRTPLIPLVECPWPASDESADLPVSFSGLLDFDFSDCEDN